MIDSSVSVSPGAAAELKPECPGLGLEDATGFFDFGFSLGEVLVGHGG